MASIDAAQEMSVSYLTTLDEVLRTAIDYLEKVRQSPDLPSQKFNLAMASRALRCALEIYRDRAELTEVK